MIRKRYVLYVLSLVLSFSVQSKVYKFELPPNLQINRVGQWMLSNAILDQVCVDFPSLCISVLDNQNTVNAISKPYQLVSKDSDIWVHQEIDIKSIELTGLRLVEINFAIFKHQYLTQKTVQDQKSLIKTYSI